MPILTLVQNGKTRQIKFEGEPLLSQVLLDSGISQAHPCGGRGICGKCRVEVQDNVSPMAGSEKRLNVRLSCQLRLSGDATVVIPNTSAMENIQIEGKSAEKAGVRLSTTLGAAVDIGTTTVALKLIDLSIEQTIASSAMLNPQTAIAADVMGRIGAAMNGSLAILQQMIQQCIRSLLDDALMQACGEISMVKKMVIAGNTTMLYLLTGKNPEKLSHAPFDADFLFGCYGELFRIPVYFPGCMHGFVGADITCALLASKICRESSTALLCDIGTNGEIALLKNGRLYVSSTAAGPAFEGAGIRNGCGSVSGAIDRVETGKNGAVICSTIGGKAPCGICGSGLIDGIAAFLRLGLIDETGACGEKRLMLTDDIAIYPEDVRSVQLAKAAIAAGIETLMEISGTKPGKISKFVVAGGFGSHLNMDSAARIGLIPEYLAGKAECIGNGALTGASMLLTHPELEDETKRIIGISTHVSLGGKSNFNAKYIENIMFPEEE